MTRVEDRSDRSDIPISYIVAETVGMYSLVYGSAVSNWQPFFIVIFFKLATIISGGNKLYRDFIYLNI